MVGFGPGKMPDMGPGPNIGPGPNMMMGPFSPPLGVVPNYENPTTRTGELLAANVACLVIAGAFVFLRLYSQMFLIGSVWWDDVVCVMSLMGSVAFSACSMRLAELGLGTHIWDVPFSRFSPHWLQMNLTLMAIYPLLIFLVKLTILLLYIRLLGICNRTKYSAYGLMVFVGAHCIAGFFSIMFACSPRRKIWDVTYRGGSCLNIQAMVISGAALNIFTDVLILLLPMPVIWNFLKIPRKQKIGLSCIFMTGSFVCVVSVIRLKEVLDSFRTADVTYAEFDTVLWSVVEVNVGIACACMPSLKILVQKTFPNLLENTAAVWKEKFTGASSSTKTSQHPVTIGRRPSRPLPLDKMLQSQTLQSQTETDIGPPDTAIGDGTGHQFSDLSGYIHDSRRDPQGVGQV